MCVNSTPSCHQGELRDLGAALTRDIFTDSPNVRWDDIAGLGEAKRLIKEAVVMPIRYPQLFTGGWAGVYQWGVADQCKRHGCACLPR